MAAEDMPEFMDERRIFLFRAMIFVEQNQIVCFCGQAQVSIQLTRRGIQPYGLSGIMEPLQIVTDFDSMGMAVVDRPSKHIVRQPALGVERLDQGFRHGGTLGIQDIVDKHDRAEGLQDYERAGIPFDVTVEVLLPVSDCSNIGNGRVLDVQQQRDAINSGSQERLKFQI